MALKRFIGSTATLSRKAVFAISATMTIGMIGVPMAKAQFLSGPTLFGTPMFSTWDEADFAKSGTKGYFGGRLTLPEGADKWPQEFQDQLKEYKVSLFASRETILEDEVPAEIKSFPYYELPTLGVDSVKIQIKRVARERGITAEQLEDFVKQHEKKSQWAVFIDPWVNVQELNRDLDKVYPMPVPEPKPVMVAKNKSTNTAKRTTIASANKTKTTAKNTTSRLKTTLVAKNAKTTKTTKTATKTASNSKATTKQAANKNLKTARS